MVLQIWRFVTLLLAALGLIMGGAHLLELAPKMAYTGPMYAAVNSTLYQYFGTIGAVLTIAAILSAGILTYLVRERPSFRLTFAGTVFLVISLVLWILLVQPVNAEWANAMQSAPQSIPEIFLRLRSRWEYGHVFAFISWLIGTCLLIASVLSEIPEDHRSWRNDEFGTKQELPRPN